jgi:hypothetical protein
MSESANYINEVKDKTAEQILAASHCSYEGPIGYYLRVAARVRTNRELAIALAKASGDSGKLQSRIVMLTLVIAGVAIVQAIATAWPYLVWWIKHDFRLA